MSASDRRSLNECISAGSTLADDLVDLISSKYHASLKRVEAQLQRQGQIAREQRARHRADMKQGEERICELERELEAATQQVERYRSRLNRY